MPPQAPAHPRLDAEADPTVPVRRSDEKGPAFDEHEARYAGVRPALLVVGDSLGVMWHENELAALGHAPIVKLAVHGDRIQHMLWRLENTRLSTLR